MLPLVLCFYQDGRTLVILWLLRNVFCHRCTASVCGISALFWREEGNSSIWQWMHHAAPARHTVLLWLSLLPMSTSSTATCLVTGFWRRTTGQGMGVRSHQQKHSENTATDLTLLSVTWAKSESQNSSELGRDTFPYRLFQDLSNLDGHAWTRWGAPQRGQGEWSQLCHCL